jgi:hypothetical protein
MEIRQTLYEISGSYGSEHKDYKHCVVLLKRTNISEVLTFSIVIRAILITLMMEVVCTSETSVYFNKITLCYIPEGCNLQDRLLLCLILAKWI